MLERSLVDICFEVDLGVFPSVISEVALVTHQCSIEVPYEHVTLILWAWIYARIEVIHAEQ